MKGYNSNINRNQYNRQNLFRNERKHFSLTTDFRSLTLLVRLQGPNLKNCQRRSNNSHPLRPNQFQSLTNSISTFHPRLQTSPLLKSKISLTSVRMSPNTNLNRSLPSTFFKIWISISPCRYLKIITLRRRRLQSLTSGLINPRRS